MNDCILNYLNMKQVYLFLLFGLASLSSVKAAPIEVIKPIVIIFDSIKSNYDTLYFKNGVNSITSNPVLSIRLSPDLSISQPLKDTIEIQPKLDYIIVNHRYSPSSRVEFVLKSGDVAHIKYNKGVPFVIIANRSVKLFDENYDYFKRQRYPCVDGMQSIDILNNPSTLLYKRIENGETSTYLKVLDEFRPILLNELKNEDCWLDSIYQSGQISDIEYHFYKDRNNYLTLDQNLGTKTLNELTNCLTEYNDSIYRNDVAGFYRNHFYRIGFNYLNAVFPSVKENKFTELYNFIQNSNILIGKLSQDLRLMSLRRIMNFSQAEVRREYFNKFSLSVSDTTLIVNLKKTYENLIDPNITNSLNIELLDCFGQKTTLTSVLKQCEGKTIYVDFWASWCVPCLEEMPVSKRLRVDPSYQNVTFIYLALNDTEEQWKSCWKKAGLETYRYNYLILNSKDAPFIKQNKIGTIPRYMIFDQKGILLNSNAPRPSDNNIQNVLKLNR